MYLLSYTVCLKLGPILYVYNTLEEERKKIHFLPISFDIKTNATVIIHPILFLVVGF